MIRIDLQSCCMTCPHVDLKTESSLIYHGEAGKQQDRHYIIACRKMDVCRIAAEQREEERK